MHPMVPLANAFLTHGHDVLWAASSELIPSLEAAGFHATPSGSAGVGLGPRPDGFTAPPMQPPVGGNHLNFFMATFADKLARPMLTDLNKIVDEYRPDLIIHEPAEFAAPIAAARAGIPSVTHGVGGMVPAELMSADQNPLADLWSEVSAQSEVGVLADELYMDIYPSSLRQAPLKKVSNIQPLRPVPYASNGSGSLPQWPDAYKELPLLFVTFGTAVPAATTPLKTVVDGLAKLDARVLVTVPTGDLSMLGQQPDNVRAVKYVATTDVLGSCAGVVSHGGAGITLAAYSSGLAQLIVPQMGDQFQNGTDCEQANAGIVVTNDQVTIERIEASGRKLLGDSQLATNARRIQAEIAQMPEPDAVCDILVSRFAPVAH
jgi:UDP:flavonoid glycosyltransferase YjiC (YdhE family)